MSEILSLLYKFWTACWTDWLIDIYISCEDSLKFSINFIIANYHDCLIRLHHRDTINTFQLHLFYSMEAKNNFDCEKWKYGEKKYIYFLYNFIYK